MAAPRKNDFDSRLLEEAEALGTDLRPLIESHGHSLAEALGVPQAVAVAALADAFAAAVAVPLAASIGREAIEASELGKSAAHELMAPLLGTSRQGVSYRLRERK